ncbi:Na+/H+ antiporter subunit E [candidate division KSB1 bacterium]|nr:Na+/H+ antiporter subunit E [candidate division KSB1 bacterium]
MTLFAVVRTFFGVISFFFFYLGEIILANIQVAYDILTPRHRMKPAILAIPLDVKTDIQLLAINNLITMTPGTLSLDISPDRKMIYVHAMYVDDIIAFKKEIKDAFEKRILEMSR